MGINTFPGIRGRSSGPAVNSTSGQTIVTHEGTFADGKDGYWLRARACSTEIPTNTVTFDLGRRATAIATS